MQACGLAPSACMCQQGSPAIYPQGAQSGHETRTVLSFSVDLRLEDLVVLLPVLAFLVSLVVVYWLPRPDLRRKPSDALLLSSSNDSGANSSVRVLAGERPQRTKPVVSFVSESNCSGSLRNYASKKSAIRSWTSETTLIPSSRNKLNGLIAPGRNELAAGPVTFVAQRRKRSMSESDLTSLVAFQHSRNRENPCSKVQSQTKDTIIITNQASTSHETARNVIRSGQTRGMSCSTEQDRQHNRQEPPMTPGTPKPAGQTASPRGQTASPRTKSYERMMGNQQACPMTPARGSPARGPCDNPIIILRTDSLELGRSVLSGVDHLY